MGRVLRGDADRAAARSRTTTARSGACARAATNGVNDCEHKNRVEGSVAFVPSVFGMTAASVAVKLLLGLPLPLPRTADPAAPGPRRPSRLAGSAPAAGAAPAAARAAPAAAAPAPGSAAPDLGACQEAVPDPPSPPS